MNATKIVRVVIMGVAIIGSFLAGDALVRWYQESTPGAKAAKEMVSQYRPGYQLPDLEGKMRDANEWNGKVVVVNFWATWCPPCKKEMPAFLELQDKYLAQGLQFVGIALDEIGKVQDFVDTMGVDYPILHGGDDAIKASENYGNRLGALPYTVVINREGYIVRTFRGEVSKSQLESVITKSL